jgi:hypothetical protein
MSMRGFMYYLCYVGTVMDKVMKGVISICVTFEGIQL